MANLEPLLSANSGETNNFFLNNDSGKLFVKKQCVTAAMNQTEILLTSKNRSNWSITISLECVIGSSYKSQKDGSFDMNIFSYENQQPLFCKNDGINRVRKVYTINFQTAELECQNWVNAVNSLIHNGVIASEEGKYQFSTQKRYLVVVNPVSGQGKGIQLWESSIKPMYEEANILVTLLVTTHQNHAFDYVHKLNPKEFQCIVCVGGDGILYEVINGLITRPDGAQVLQSLPIAAVPAGSGNGLSKSVLYDCHHMYSLVNATFLSIKGTPKPLDLSLYETPKTAAATTATATTTACRPYYSFLCLSFGLISDVDIRTEFMRCLGELRFTLGAVYYSFVRRTYHGKLYIYNNQNTGDNKNPTATMSLPDSNLVSADNTMTSSTSTSTNTSKIPSITEDIDLSPGSGWECIENDFNLIWAIQVSHVSISIHASPTSKLDDGVFTILVADHCSTLELLHLLILAETGDHIKHPKVKVYRTTAFRYVPSNITDDGIYSLDGELIEYGPVQGRILPSAIQMMSLNTSNDN